jgi:hypothetical protein
LIARASVPAKVKEAKNPALLRIWKGMALAWFWEAMTPTPPETVEAPCTPVPADVVLMP